MRLMLLLVSAFVAYHLGIERGHESSRPNTVAKIDGQKLSVAPTFGRKDQARSRLTRDEAWAQLQDALEQPNRVARGKLLNDIIMRIDPGDIPALVVQARELPSGLDPDIAITQMLGILSFRDPITALSLLDAINNLQMRHTAAGQIYKTLATAAGSERAIAELAKIPRGQPAQEAYRNVFEGWAGANAANSPFAAATAFTLPSGTERNEALRGVVLGWSSRDPQATLEWASTLPAESSIALQEALNAISKTKPALAAKYLDKLADAAARNHAIEGISMGISNSDPEAALTWLDQVATGDTYDKSVSNLFAALAQRDPMGATTLLSKVTEPGIREAVITRVASIWAQRNPQAALAWLRGLPDTDRISRDATIQKLMLTHTAPSGAATQ